MIEIRRPLPLDQIRLLVWDLDGTLVDSMPDLASCVNRVRKTRNLPALDQATVQSYVGSGARTLIRKSLEPIAEPALDEALADFLDTYEKHLLDETTPYPFIPEVLTELGQSFTQAILTNKPLPHSLKIMEGLQLDHHFKGIYGGDTFKVRKPDPAGAIEMLRNLGLEPNQAIMIGDSDNDTLTAQRAGMWSIGVRYGYSPQSFEMAPADIYVDEVTEIRKVLKKG